MMPATSAQFAQLSTVLDKRVLEVLLPYIDSQITPANQAASFIQQLTVSPLPYTYTSHRVFDTDFVVSPDRNARVMYSISLPTKLLVIGNDECTVALLVNGVEVSRVTNYMALGVGLSINDTRIPIKTLTASVLAGQTVRISIIAQSATASAPTFADQQETLE